MLCRQRDNEIAVICDEGVGDADDSTAPLARPRRECGLNIGIIAARY